MNRSPGIDLVRILGLVAIAAFHLWGGVPGAMGDVVRVVTLSWAVPLYFFLSGYFWTRGRTIRSEVTSRARSLLVPYVAFTIVLGIPYFALAAVRTGNPIVEIGNTLWGGSRSESIFAPFWFLPVLFATAVLLRVSERWPRWVPWALAIVGLAVCIPFGSELAQVPLDLPLAVPALFFSLVGQQARARMPKLRHPLVVGAISLAVGGVLFATRLATAPDLKFGDFGTPVLTVLGSMAICIGIVLLSTTLLDGRERRWAPVAQELAQTTIVVLLAHAALYFVLNPLGLPLGVMFVVALCVCWAAATVLHRTPLSPIFVGIPRLKQRMPQPANQAL